MCINLSLPGNPFNAYRDRCDKKNKEVLFNGNIYSRAHNNEQSHYFSTVYFMKTRAKTSAFVSIQLDDYYLKICFLHLRQASG
jgi:hypothetical protein